MRYDDRVHWLYRCFDEAGALLYVGATSNLQGRLAQHRSGSVWAPLVTKVRAVVLPDGPSARAAEREAIAQEHPKWNKSGRWQHRHTWTREQWHDYMRMQVARSQAPVSGDQMPHMASVVRGYAAIFDGPVPEFFTAEIDRATAERDERERRQDERNARQRAAIEEADRAALAAHRRSESKRRRRAKRRVA